VTVINLFELAGEFAEDKDIARNIRIDKLLPALANGETVEIDFAQVGLATQSFIHALVSDVVRKEGPNVLDRIVFSNCNSSIKSLIRIVTEYSQDQID